MSRPLSNTLRTALAAESTGEQLIPLLTIEHPDLDATLRFAGDYAAVVSRGMTFTPFDFDIVLPNDDGTPPRAKLWLGNADRAVVLALRGLIEPPAITVELVRASNPDFVEMDVPELELLDSDMATPSTEAALGYQDLSIEPFPQQTYVRSFFPGMP